MERRQFIKSSALAIGATTAAGVATSLAEHHEKTPGPLVKKGDVILFQGDSITDAGRSRKHAAQANQHEALGKGYAWLAASQLLVDRPTEQLKIFNRGISGHKVPQLAGRWQKDCLDLKPDVLSILIGVNDIWHGLNGKYDGTPASYEKAYLALVERTLKALPEVKLVICEPFVLRCGAVKDNWFPTFDAYRASAKKVAKTFGATFVPFQSMFDKAANIAPPEHWARDGVHPTADGASLMAHNWLKAVH
ncbi:MAG: SGNH/GDSL hydrolase family protein [Akkermansiaceae bacterium]|nr:SGNH/GDSL hydrolase family protein [Akkermansiaceae bacterium]